MKRLFLVNNVNLLGIYVDPDLKVYVYKKHFDLIFHKKISLLLDFWIAKDCIYCIQKDQDHSLNLNITSTFKNETKIKLDAKDLKAFKVTGDWIYIASSDGLHIHSKQGDHVLKLDINHSLQQVSLAFDAFERFVGFSTDEAPVIKKDGIKGGVNYGIYELAVANDIIAKEYGWVVIKDVKNNEDFAHWRAHTTEVLKISFSSSGLKVFTSTLGSNSFHVWDLVNITDKQPNLLYVLSRGYTPASLYDISWTKNDIWLSVSTSHGTSHLYFLNPFSKESNTYPKNQSPEIRVRRPLEQGRRDFLTYHTGFIHPIEVVEDSVMLSLVSAHSNGFFTIDIFEVTGSFDSFSKIVLAQSHNIRTVENSKDVSEFSKFSAQLNTSSAKTDLARSWHSLVSVESYPTQPFWSLNNVSFFTFEDKLPPPPYEESCPDLSNFPGTKPFNIIESAALPNGTKSSSVQFPAVNWNGQSPELLRGAIDIELNKNEAIVINPIVDLKKRNNVSFDDEWTVQVEGVQMEDVIV